MKIFELKPVSLGTLLDPSSNLLKSEGTTMTAGAREKLAETSLRSAVLNKLAAKHGYIPLETNRGTGTRNSIQSTEGTGTLDSRKPSKKQSQNVTAIIPIPLVRTSYRVNFNSYETAQIDGTGEGVIERRRSVEMKRGSVGDVTGVLSLLGVFGANRGLLLVEAKGGLKVP